MKTLLEYIKRGTKQVEKGIKKYGGTLDEKELSAVELIDHSIEESVDNIFYMLKLREQLQVGNVSSEIIVKYCGNCRHYVKGTCHQGHDCSRKSHWQPLKDSREKLEDRSVPTEVKEQTSKSCHSCKHLDISAYKEPCRTCCNKRNWQPRNEGSE